jgi:hypothetical protein
VKKERRRPGIHTEFGSGNLLQRGDLEDRKEDEWKDRRRGMHKGYWWVSQKEGDHWEDQDVDGWTILKWILERYGFDRSVSG